MRARQQGIFVLAFTLLLVLVAAAVMVRMAGRLPDSNASDTTQRLNITTLLDELKVPLIAAALQEDNTPGAFPCPNGGSCAPDAAGLVNQRTVPTSALVLTRLGTSAPPCVQYVLAPSLRNSLNTDLRGIDNFQKSINPGLEPDLYFVNSTGSAVRAWVVLLGGTGTGAGACSLSTLGYQLIVNSTTGIATLSASNTASMKTASATILSRDMVAGLFDQVLTAVDFTSFKTYLNTRTSSTRDLASIRLVDITNFDSALAHGVELQTVRGCPEVVTPSSSSSSASSTSTSSSASSASSSKPSTSKFPVSWLCFNAWYGYVKYNPGTFSFEASDPDTGVKCTRQAGKTSCTRTS